MGEEQGALTIPEVVERAATRFKAAEGLVDGDRRMSFAEVAEAADGAARAFVAAGIEPGDRVALWSPNSWHWPVAALGVHYAGEIGRAHV